jgi:hypothetical protein
VVKMTNTNERTDKELADYVIDHIERDIELNKRRHNVDFTYFLSNVIDLSVNEIYWMKTFRTIQAALLYTTCKLSETTGKNYIFLESAKAGMAISRIKDQEQLNRLEEYANKKETEGFATLGDSKDPNYDALTYFLTCTRLSTCDPYLSITSK